MDMEQSNLTIHSPQLYLLKTFTTFLKNYLYHFLACTGFIGYGSNLSNILDTIDFFPFLTGCGCYVPVLCILKMWYMSTSFL